MINQGINLIKKEKKRNLTAIKNIYFIKKPDISTEQVQKLLTLSAEYKNSINLKCDAKIKINILQSSIALILTKPNKK